MGKRVGPAGWLALLALAACAANRGQVQDTGQDPAMAQAPQTRSQASDGRLGVQSQSVPRPTVPLDPDVMPMTMTPDDSATAGGGSPSPMKPPERPTPMMEDDATGQGDPNDAGSDPEPFPDAEGCTQLLEPLSPLPQQGAVSGDQIEAALEAHGLTRMRPEYSDFFVTDMENQQLVYLFVAHVDDFTAKWGFGDVTHGLDGVDCRSVTVSDSVLSAFEDPQNLIAPPPFDLAAARRACTRFQAGVAAGYLYEARWDPGCGGCGGRPGGLLEFEWYSDGVGEATLKTHTCRTPPVCPPTCYSRIQLFEMRSDWPPLPVSQTVCIPLDEPCDG